MKKKIGIALFVVIAVFSAKHYYDVHLNYNFDQITEGKVYKSGVIPPDKLGDYMVEYGIKSVIDLRYPGTSDLENNPEIPEELLAEREAIEKLPEVNYFNVGSDQVPSKEVLEQFFVIMDDPDNYPVLIHCHHGRGRAPLFSALYRIEYEGFSNQKARSMTRTFLKGSSFDKGKPKGDFLINYVKRKD